MDERPKNYLIINSIMKKFRGLIIKESLEDESVLDLVEVTKEEKWNVSKSGKFLPKKWTACYIQGDKSQIDFFAEKLSQTLKPKGCYANLGIDKDSYVIFPNKVFKYKRGDEQKRQKAIKYGRSLEIPEHQLDWGE